MIPVRLRGTLALAVTFLAGLAAFGWPLFVVPGSPVVGTSQTPLLFAVLLLVVLGVVLVELSRGGLEVTALAMLGVLTALGAVLRALSGGAAGLELVFALFVLAGRVFGPGFGFVLGGTTLFTSALLTAGVGPWLPFQMVAAGFVGAFAGLLPPARGRVEIALLAGYGAVSGLLYGTLMNLSFWPFTLGPGTQLSYAPGAPLLDNLQRFALFTLATSLGWDLVRSVSTVVLIVAFGHGVLVVLRRGRRRVGVLDG